MVQYLPRRNRYSVSDSDWIVKMNDFGPLFLTREATCKAKVSKGHSYLVSKEIRK